MRVRERVHVAYTHIHTHMRKISRNLLEKKKKIASGEVNNWDIIRPQSVAKVDFFFPRWDRPSNQCDNRRTIYH